MTVVCDTPTQLMLYVPGGTAFLAPADERGRVTREVLRERGVAPDVWRDAAALHIIPAGAAHSVMARWGTSFDDFRGYYVNLQEPVRRTANGFDTMDQTLDLVVSHDLAHCELKDQDELCAATEGGFFSRAEFEAIRAEAAHVVDAVQRRAPPFDRSWREWRPDPSWSDPVLPLPWAQRLAGRSTEIE